MSFLQLFFCIIFFFIWFSTASVNINTEDECECVPFYLCTNGTINTSGKGIIDIRIDNSSRCSSFLEYCCDTKAKLLKPSQSNSPPPENRGCGYRNPKGVGYNLPVGSDSESRFGEFPWMIAVFHKAKNSSKHFFKCGGSLIHPQVVLTAAHCVTDEGSYKIRAGEWDYQTTEEIFRYEDRNVVSFSKHPRFDTRNLQNDIAMLFLQSPLDLVAHINVICLPPHEPAVLSSKCFVHGWGKHQGENITVLKKVELATLTRSQCQNDFRQTRLGTRFNLHRSTLCAGGEEQKDSCKGDGGGPLVCPIAGKKDRYQQVGIVSWGIGCGTKNVPGAYADVAYLRYWIDQQLLKKNVSIIEYQHWKK